MKHLVLFFTALTLLSCGEELSREDLLPDASGEHGKILLLVDDGIWESEFQEKIKAQMAKNIDGVLLRPEPQFDYFRKDPDDLNHVNKLSRIILKVFVDHDSSYAETAFIVKKNYFARGQIFLVLKDSDFTRLCNYVDNNFDEVAKTINDFELKELKRIYANGHNAAAKEQAEINFGISINIPKNSSISDLEDDFMLVKHDQSQQFQGDESMGTTAETYWIQEGIVFWENELAHDSLFNPYHIMALKDSVWMHKLPGKSEGSYMTTEYDPDYSPEVDKTTLAGQEAFVVRGLWKFDGHPGAFGGGPFIQYSFMHPNTKKMLSVAGYIYAPRFDKREYMRQIEAMLQSIVIFEE